MKSLDGEVKSKERDIEGTLESKSLFIVKIKILPIRVHNGMYFHFDGKIKWAIISREGTKK
jgi:hypothetical protein